MRRTFLFALLAAGCGSMNSTPVNAPSPIPGIQNAGVTGQYNLVLTSTNGHAQTNIYARFAQTGTTLIGGADALICRSNDVSQCVEVSTAPTGTVSGANVSILIPFVNSVGAANAVTLVGSVTGTSLSGTYTDILGDSGTWSASTAMQVFGPSPSVVDYSGTFNSTANPLLIPPTILIELGQGANSDLSGKATVTNFPCVSSLSLFGQAAGDAFNVTDASSKATLIAIPASPGSSNFNFSYRFDSTSPSCAGDFGYGVITTNSSPWGY